MTLEQQIANILDAPCGKHSDRWKQFGLRDCPDCLPKRIAAAIEAAAYDSIGGYYEGALRALKGEA